jgi:hypothetical protein
MLQIKEGAWTIIDKVACPDWLRAFEKELERGIIEHQA